MDDKVQKAISSALLTLMFLTGIITHAVDFEHISLDKKTELERQFNEARSATANSNSILNRKWTCDMYGVRSRLQVKRNVNLYSLNATELGIANSGAQVVSSYGATNGNLSGRNSRFEDQLRLTPDGLLLSRLSLHGQTEPGAVIAYSVCR